VLKRVLYTVLLTAAVSQVSWENSASSQESDDSPPRYHLDVIVTTAFRESEQFLYTVSELTALDIRERNLTTLDQALNYLPGVRTSVARLGHGKYVSVRGFEQHQLLILVDGIPLYNPYDGLIELDHIPTDQIESVRLIKGPGATLYGPNALGGVINIITKNSSQKPYRGAVAELGGNESTSLRLQHGWQQGPVKLRFSAGRTRSDGFRLSENFKQTAVPDLPGGELLLSYEDGGRRDNSGYTKNTAHLNLGYAPDKRLHLDLSGSLVDNEWGVPPHPFYNPDKNKSRIRYWRFNDWRLGRINLTAGAKPNEHILLRVSTFYAQYDNTLDSYDDDTYSSQQKGYAFHSVFDDHAVGGNLQVTGHLGIAGDVSAAGGIIQDVHRDTPNLSEPTLEYRMRTAWVSVEDKVQVRERITLDGGISYSLLNKQKAGAAMIGDDMTTLCPRISMAYLLSRTSRLYLTLACTSRFPTMKQLYGTDSNSQLRSQRVDHLELGGEWSLAPTSRLQAALFYDRAKDLIESNYISRTADNITKARIWGGELTLSGKPSRFLRAMLGYSFLRARNRSSRRPGEHLQYRPEHQLDWRLWIELPSRFRILFDGVALSRQYYYDDFHERRLSHLAPYAVAHVTLKREFSFGLEPFLIINNILDAAYPNVYTSPAPGREIRGGMRMSW
jgi:iron complex outermembrane receptor protein/outer membrane receptor for ferrienterochelin and colicins